MLGRRSTRTLAALPATLLLATALAPAGASAAGETCRGVAATIVHTNGYVQYGTDGRDVIVTSGGQVITGGGDDLVCVIDGPGSWSLVDVGDGDDVVDTTARTKGTSVGLGEGSDHFYGGPGSDNVGTGDTYAADVDVVDTGTSLAPEGDEVYSGHPGLVNHDAITIDSGRVVFSGTPGAGTKVAGGPTASLSYDAPSFVSSDLDADAHVWRIDQRPPLSFTGFAHFDLQANAASTYARYRGTQGDDSFWLWMAPGSDLLPTLDVAMRGGDDRFQVSYRPSLTFEARTHGPTLPPSRITGGAGHDVLTIKMSLTDHISLDLASGQLLAGDDDTEATTLARGFDDAKVQALAVDVSGTSGPNDISVDSCRSRVDGRAGRDTLTAFVEIYSDRELPEIVNCDHRPATLLGGKGADVLTGNYGNDRLFGGRGSDSATGRKGRDVCSAERTRSCEVRR